MKPARDYTAVLVDDESEIRVAFTGPADQAADFAADCAEDLGGEAMQDRDGDWFVSVTTGVL